MAENTDTVVPGDTIGGDREHIKQFINHLVYDREDDAKKSFHDFIQSRTRNILGDESELDAAATKPAAAADETDETITADDATETDPETKTETETTA